MACDKFVIIVLQSGRLEVTDKSVFLGLLQKLTVTDPTVTVKFFLGTLPRQMFAQWAFTISPKYSCH